MPKVHLSLRISDELKKAATNDAKKRGIKLSKYTEIALIHELNRKTDNGTIHELEHLQSIISQRIEELKVDEDEIEEDIEIQDPIETSIQEVYSLQNTFGYVSEGAVVRNAEFAGVTLPEFLKLLKEHNVEITILD